MALLAVLADVSQLQRVTLRTGNLLRAPQHAVESANTAMQVILAVVQREPILLASQCKAATRDAIGVAANNAAEVRVVVSIAIETIVAEHHVVELSRSIRNLQRSDNAAVVCDFDFDAFIGQRE